jgi:hypothetical protein
MSSSVNLCKLCMQYKPMVDAHIIPKGLYNLAAGSPLSLVPMYTDERPQRSQTGLYDQEILCEECDVFLGRLDQHAVERLAPGRANLKATHPPDGPALDAKGKPLLYTIEGADSDTISRFVLSVLWRAHHSGRAETRVVRLGPHADVIRDILLKELNVGDHPYVVTLEHNPDMQFAMLVGNNRQQGIMLHTFYASNFGFHAKIDKRSFGEPMSLLALRSKRPVLSISFEKRTTPFGRNLIGGLRRNYSKFGDPWKRKAS